MSFNVQKICSSLSVSALIFAGGFFALLSPERAEAWNLEGTCTGVPAEVFIGETVTWKASQTSTAISGDGTFYTWQWSGTDGLSGTTQNVTKSYATSGTKHVTANITLVIGPGKTESANALCSIRVKEAPKAILKVIKEVVNVDGGNKTVSDFTIFVKSGNSHVSGSPVAGSAAGTTFTLPAGNYVVGESNIPSDYLQTGISGDCTANGNVTLAAGDNKICRITNTHKTTPATPGCTGNCGGGGGYNPPRVTLLSKPDPQPLAFVYLSQIPYTGITDNLPLLIFLNVIIVWSILVAYLGRKGTFGAFVRRAGVFTKNLLRWRRAPMVLRPNQLVSVEQPAAKNIRTESGETQVNSNAASVAPVRFTFSPLSAAAFIRAIGARDFKKISTALQGNGGDGALVAKRTISELDRVYRARVEGGSGVTEEIRAITASWSNEKIEAVITTLFGTLDQHYKDRTVTAKLAALRLAEIS